ncbi:PAZ domain-containing protein [Mycena rebaudengoi]|nr:PAZ domain-containing protein [Mycena rebaudengoi]
MFFCESRDLSPPSFRRNAHQAWVPKSRGSGRQGGEYPPQSTYSICLCLGRMASRSSIIPSFSSPSGPKQPRLRLESQKIAKLSRGFKLTIRMSFNPSVPTMARPTYFRLAIMTFLNESLPSTLTRIVPVPIEKNLLRQLNSPKFKKQVNEAASSVLNLLNVFIQSEPKTAYPSLYGKNTVFSSRGQKDTRSVAPLELWMGIFQSVRPAMDKIVINIDTTVGVVVPKNALEDFCWTYCRNTFNMNNRKLWQLNPSEFQELRTFARDIKITIKTAGRPARSVKIKDLVKDCGEVRFLKKITGNQTVEMTVADHFFHVHNITIPPRSLGVKVGHNEVFPISICTTVNQLYKNKLPPQYTAHTLKFLPANPEARLKKIEDAWQHLEYKNSQFLQGGNINFNPSFVGITVL